MGQIAAGIWMVSPSTWSIGLLEIALRVVIVILAMGNEVTMLWTTAAVPILVGGLFVFSGGLPVVWLGTAVFGAVAIDSLIGHLRA